MRIVLPCLVLALVAAPAALAGGGEEERRQSLYGGPDADADGVPDARDRCPQVSAMSRNGCPRIFRKVTISATEGRVSGEIKRSLEPCEANERVKLFRVRRGPDKRVASLQTDAEGEWESEKRFHAGRRLFAKLPRHTEPSAGRCIAARSHSVEV